MVAETVMGDPRSTTGLYGGRLYENEIQATARDILCDAWIALTQAGINVLFTIYDEIVTMVREDEVEERLKEQEYIMCNSSPWLKGCPLRVKSSITKVYEK